MILQFQTNIVQLLFKMTYNSFNMQHKYKMKYSFNSILIKTKYSTIVCYNE